VSLMLVGEQPGDAEDRAGRPFVGPSGRLLDAALEAAGIDRDDTYVTNAVKHFKWEAARESKRRIHKKPTMAEVRACAPWLDEEIRVVRPRVILCLGATAAKLLIGPTFSVMQHRGTPVMTAAGVLAFATVHPSAVLRAPSDTRREAEQAFIADVRAVGVALRGAPRAKSATPARSRATRARQNIPHQAHRAERKRGQRRGRVA
jgi:uracil-DNA glycosylase family protein